jgi:hypothetical protein
MRSREWEAARASAVAAETALDNHKRDCTPCATPRQQMCPTGRGLLNHLWDCQRAQNDAWHKRPPADQPTLFGTGKDDPDGSR